MSGSLEVMKSFVEFLQSYPLWAKVLATSGLLITALTLIFAPRATVEKGEGSEKTSDSEVSSRVYLTIKGVTLFPANEEEAIQIYAYVNGTAYKYPSIAGVEWLQVGPTMSPGIFEIPESGTYEVRFEGKIRGPYGPELASQEIITVSKLPKHGTYSLHDVHGGLRSAGVSARIRFSIEKK